jgi:hypothetical protein
LTWSSEKLDWEVETRIIVGTQVTNLSNSGKALFADQTTVGSDVVQRMSIIRSKRVRRVAELHNEAERMTDWREHVKSAPIVAIASSALIGFIASRSVSRMLTSASPQQPLATPLPIRFSEPKAASTRLLMSGTLRYLTDIALTAGKVYLLQQINSRSKEPSQL